MHWWAEASDKRRPVLVVTRSVAIPVLMTATLATNNIRKIVRASTGPSIVSSYLTKRNH